MNNRFVYLASESPRRAELLRQLGLRFEIVSAPVDEDTQMGEAPQDYVQRLARDKIEAAVQRLGSGSVSPVLAADTVVVVDRDILGKPAGRRAGLDMLAQLSGRSHQVLSAVAVWHAGRLWHALSTSTVTFRILPPDESAAYWDTGEPADKGGGYAIQGRAALFVERLEGSYSGVMGLPLFETAELLRQAGVRIL